jgi:hypothetical protein
MAAAGMRMTADGSSSYIGNSCVATVMLPGGMLKTAKEFKYDWAGDKKEGRVPWNR